VLPAARDFLANEGGKLDAGAVTGGEVFLVVRTLGTATPVVATRRSLAAGNLVWDTGGERVALCGRDAAGWHVVCGETVSEAHEFVGRPYFDERGVRFGTRDGRDLWWRTLRWARRLSANARRPVIAETCRCSQCTPEPRSRASNGARSFTAAEGAATTSPVSPAPPILFGPRRATVASCRTAEPLRRGWTNWRDLGTMAPSVQFGQDHDQGDPTMELLMRSRMSQLVAVLGLFALTNPVRAQDPPSQGIGGDYVVTRDGEPIEEGATWRIHWTPMVVGEVTVYWGYTTRDDGTGPVPRKDPNAYFLAVPNGDDFEFRSLGSDPNEVTSGKLTATSTGLRMDYTAGPGAGTSTELTPET